MYCQAPHDSVGNFQLYYEFDNRTTSDLIVEVIKHASGIISCHMSTHSNVVYAGARAEDGTYVVRRRKRRRGTCRES